MDPRLSDAAKNGDIYNLRWLLDEDPQILDKISSSPDYKETPLHVASRAGKADFVRELITRMPSFATEKDLSDGVIPLHIASASGYLDIVTQLLKLETGLEQCHFKDTGGRIPLHHAVIRGRVPVIEVLISHSAESLVEVTEGGETVLHLAAKNNHSQALQVLIERMKEHGNLGAIFGAKEKKEGKTFWELQTTEQSTNEMKQLENTVLVVAILIVTVTYQAGLTPPPTIWNEGRKLDARCLLRGPKFSLKEPTNSCPAFTFYMFMVFNTTGFLSSVLLIAFRCMKSRQVVLLMSIIPLLANYGVLLFTLSPDYLSTFVLLVFSVMVVVVFAVSFFITIRLRRTTPVKLLSYYLRPLRKLLNFGL